jgi:hypothetical protein
MGLFMSPDTERRYSRREFFEGLRELVFGGITFSIGLQGGRNLTIGELQSQTNFKLDQAEKIRDGALEYITKIEEYDLKLKTLVPPIIIVASIPTEEKPLCAFGLYEVTNSMICDNQEFLDAIAKAVTLLIPRSYLGMRRINLEIQLIKPVDKPQKPITLLEQPNHDLLPNLERTN